MQNNEYYLWGAGTYGRRIINFMKNDLTFKAVIDNDQKKQKTLFCGLPVISYAEAKKKLPETKMVISLARPYAVRELLLNEGFVQNRDFYFAYDFPSKYYWSKRRLVVGNANLIATTLCNMHCIECQSFIPIAQNYRNYTAEDIKCDVDLMFKHIDAELNIIFSCGESLLNSEALADACSHIKSKYSGRYHALCIITNGSIIPDDGILHAFSKSNTILSITDYPENKEVTRKLVEKCILLNVPYFINASSKEANWYEYGDPRVLLETNPERLRSRKCWTKGAAFFEGRLYMCAMQAWFNAVVEPDAREPSDVFDLRQPKTVDTIEEVFRMISMQSELGYVSHCMRCNGMKPLVSMK